MYVSKARLNTRHVNAHGQHSPSLITCGVVLIACVASVSSRVIVRKLEQEQKTTDGRERGEEEKLARKPQDSGKCPLTFHGSVDL